MKVVSRTNGERCIIFKMGLTKIKKWTIFTLLTMLPKITDGTTKKSGLTYQKKKKKKKKGIFRLLKMVTRPPPCALEKNPFFLLLL